MKFLIVIVLIFTCKPKQTENTSSIENSSNSVPITNIASSEDTQYQVPTYCSSGGSMFVSADSGLRVREKPDLNSKSLGTVLKGHTVEFISVAEEAVTVEGKLASFFKVNTQFGEGYVYSGYLNYTKNRENEICGYNTEIEVESNSGNYYIKAIPPENCGCGMYPDPKQNGICSYYFFNSKNQYIHVFENKERHCINGWASKNEILTERNEGDDGCYWRSKSAMNIHTFNIREIQNNSTCP
jgi:hypothetical protein